MHAPIPWTAPYPSAPGKYCACTIGTAAGPPPQPSSCSSSSNSGSFSPDMTGHVFWHCQPRTLPQLRWGPHPSWTPWTDRPYRSAALPAIRLPGAAATSRNSECVLLLLLQQLLLLLLFLLLLVLLLVLMLHTRSVVTIVRCCCCCWCGISCCCCCRHHPHRCSSVSRPLPACAPLSAPPCPGQNLNTRSGHAPSSNEVVSRHLSMNTSTIIQ